MNIAMMESCIEGLVRLWVWNGKHHILCYHWIVLCCIY